MFQSLKLLTGDLDRCLSATENHRFALNKWRFAAKSSPRVHEGALFAMTNRPPRIPNPRRPLEDEWRVIAVTPRYLAGGGLNNNLVFGPLIRPTWRYQSQGNGNYHAFGDADRLHVAFVPEDCAFAEAEGVWHIAARSTPDQPRVWQMDFDFDTPLELIAGVTVRLAHDAESRDEPRPYLSGRHHDDMGAVWQPLADAGWAITCDKACYVATSPDGVATVAYAPPREGSVRDQLSAQAWLVEVAPDPDLDPLWCAQFHDATPRHLIAEFTKALADPAPLTRERHRIPHMCRDLINPA